MTDAQKIQGTDDAWESGALGDDEAFARASNLESSKAADDVLDLQAISIRLPKSLIASFKLLAQIHEMGYQPLMREALIRFADHEMKLVATAYANQLKSERKEASKEASKDAAQERERLQAA